MPATSPRCSDQDIKNANLSLLRDCQRDIAQLTPEDDNDRYALRNIMEAHGELGTLRSKRIGAIGEKMPPYLMWPLVADGAGPDSPFMSEPLMKDAVARSRVWCRTTPASASIRSFSCWRR